MCILVLDTSCEYLRLQCCVVYVHEKRKHLVGDVLCTCLPLSQVVHVSKICELAHSVDIGIDFTTH